MVLEGGVWYSGRAPVASITPAATITLREDAVNSADAKPHSYCVSAENYIAAVDCEFEKG